MFRKSNDRLLQDKLLFPVPSRHIWDSCLLSHTKSNESQNQFLNKGIDSVAKEFKGTCLILVFGHSTAFAGDAALHILVLSFLARNALNGRAWRLFGACWAELAHKGNPCVVHQFGGECACRDSNHSTEALHPSAVITNISTSCSQQKDSHDFSGSFLRFLSIAF